MANWISLTRQIQHCYGVAAQHVGIPTDVYRLSINSNGDWIQPSNLIYPGVYVDREPMKAGTVGFESAKRMETFWYTLMCNCTPLLLGDIFIAQNVPLLVGSVTVTYPINEFIGFCLAENMPTRGPVAARLNTTAQLFTPSILPNNQNYYDSTLPNKMPIVCENGQFAPAPALSEGSNIPVGSMPFRNYGQIYNQPTANVTPAERRIVYIPPLPGYMPIAGDELVFADGSRYTVESNYQQRVGTVGTQAIVTKIVSGQAQ